MSSYLILSAKTITWGGLAKLPVSAAQILQPNPPPFFWEQSQELHCDPINSFSYHSPDWNSDRALMMSKKTKKTKKLLEYEMQTSAFNLSAAKAGRAFD